MFKSSTRYKDGNTGKEVDLISHVSGHTVHKEKKKRDYLQEGYLSFSLSYISPHYTFCALKISKSLASSWRKSLAHST